MNEFIGDFSHQGQIRRYIFVQGSLRSGLVVLLHPFGGDAEQIRAMEGKPLFDAGFSLLIPQGYRNSWNADFCCGEALAKQIPDSAFLRELTSFILKERDFPPDSTVFLSGFSNGAFLASKVALESLQNPTQKSWLSGISLRSGYSYDLSLYTKASTNFASNGIPVLGLHGALDAHVQISGCCSSSTSCCCNILAPTCVSFAQAMNAWKEVNRCKPSPGMVQEQLGFFNFSTSAMNQTCQALPGCNVFSCEFPNQNHFVTKFDVSQMIAQFFSFLYFSRQVPSVNPLLAPSSPVSLKTPKEENGYLVWIVFIVLLALTLFSFLYKFSQKKNGHVYAVLQMTAQDEN